MSKSKEKDTESVPSIMDITRSLKTLHTKKEIEATLEVLKQFKLDFIEEDKDTYQVTQRVLNTKLTNAKDESGELDGIKMAYSALVDDVRQQLTKAMNEGRLTQELVEEKSAALYSEQKKFFFRRLPHGVSKESNKMLKSFYDQVKLEARKKA